MWFIKKNNFVNSTAVPGLPSLGLRTECEKSSFLGDSTKYGPGGMSGKWQSAYTWGRLLMITRMLRGTDGFGKHFCRILLTEKKRKGIWFMLIDRLLRKCVQKYKLANWRTSGTGNFASVLMCVKESDDICIQAKLQRVTISTFHPFLPGSHLLFWGEFPKWGWGPHAYESC